MKLARKMIIFISAFALIAFAGWVYLSRPHHKYRLTVEVETPNGMKSATHVMAVFKDKLSIGGIGGGTALQADALFINVHDNRNLIALLAHGPYAENPNEMNQLAMDAFAAQGKKVDFRDIPQLTGTVPIMGKLVPTLATFTDINDPKSAQVIAPDSLEAWFGSGYRLRHLSLQMIPVGLWPFDYGGVLGEPVTRALHKALPWLNDAWRPKGNSLCRPYHELCLLNSHLRRK